ncbi:hypothetical protein Isop_2338 [Isosphaera pallida ATCC 43644]|uniref:Tetratricopeptide repeat protein n=1 Tax=Isosphaera pallida (strain ATCC 43644 / DSM 9630 / IS1B) TaxID=575540 RepID=E8R6K5_ISOPI|nr:hypothetical protein Isop_2338 [Isosphaera pallida ATCC 43644]
MMIQILRGSTPRSNTWRAGIIGTLSLLGVGSGREGIPHPARGQDHAEIEKALASDEADVERMLAFRRRQVLDTSRPILERAGIALQAAAGLDRLAKSANDPTIRRRRWLQAAELLEEFNQIHPKHPQIRQSRLQIIIFRWAAADTLVWTARLDPAHQALRAEAARALDDVVSRAEAVMVEEASLSPDAITWNLRYRLALALADRVELAEEAQRFGVASGSQRKEGQLTADRRTGTDEWNRVLAVLQLKIEEPRLAALAALVRARALIGLGRLDEADRQLSQAEAVLEPDETLTPRMRLEQTAGRLQRAETLLNQSNASVPLKALERVRLALRRTTSRDQDLLLPSPNVLITALAELDRLAGDTAWGRLGLIEACRVLKPSPALGSDLAARVAQGRLLLNDPSAAADFFAAAAVALEQAPPQANANVQTAPQSDAKANPPLHPAAPPDDPATRARWVELWIQAAGAAGRAGDPIRAAAWLEPIWTLPDERLGPHGPRLGMLRALIRGQAASLPQPISDPAAVGLNLDRNGYEQALRDQLQRFPHDPSLNEARWLLGGLRAAQDPKEALELWAAIPNESPRWLDARLARLDLMLDQLHRDHRDADRDTVDSTNMAITQLIADSLHQVAADPNRRRRLELKQLEWQVHPAVRRAEEARLEADRLIEAEQTRPQVDRNPAATRAALKFKVVALALLNRQREAEEMTRQLTGQPPSSSNPHLTNLKPDDSKSNASPIISPAPLEERLDLARRLDLQAAERLSNSEQRRFAHLALMVIESILNDPQARHSPEEGLFREARLRRILALQRLGDGAAARREWDELTRTPTDALSQTPPPPNLSSLLRSTPSTIRLAAEVADAIARFDQAALLWNAYSRTLTSGTNDWLDARFHLAVSLQRLGRPRDARRVLEAAAVLVPELGGGRLQTRVAILRQQLR